MYINSVRVSSWYIYELHTVYESFANLKKMQPEKIIEWIMPELSSLKIILFNKASIEPRH